VVAQLSDVRGSVRVAAGYAKPYLDEPWQFTAGASFRFYVSRRLSLEPEFMVSPGTRFKQWTFIPSVALDLVAPGKRVTPYVIGGIGYFHELDKSAHYKHSELSWNGGVGVRIRYARGAFIAPEFRIGHISRVAVGVGYLF
jgi:hypothetical protein